MTDLTKQEINLRIARLVYPECEVIQGYGVTGAASFDIVRAKHGTHMAVPDYCNNWDDLIPLMIKHNTCYQLSNFATAKDMAARLLEILEDKK